MRIIYENNQEYIHKCKYCKSIYAYTEKDVDRSFYVSIRCPVCKSIDSLSIFDKKSKIEKTGGYIKKRRVIK